jgi:hypothetical protein
LHRAVRRSSSGFLRTVALIAMTVVSFASLPPAIARESLVLAADRGEIVVVRVIQVRRIKL